MSEQHHREVKQCSQRATIPPLLRRAPLETVANSIRIVGVAIIGALAVGYYFAAPIVLAALAHFVLWQAIAISAGAAVVLLPMAYYLIRKLVAL